MEKADRLTGRTIQAVIGLAVSWRCPKHGVRGGGFGLWWQHDRGDEVRSGWGIRGHQHTGGDMRGQKGGMAQLFCSTEPSSQQQPERGQNW